MPFAAYSKAKWACYNGRLYHAGVGFVLPHDLT